MTILIDDSPKTTQSNSQSPALELRGVTRKFGTSVAVDDVSFTLNTGTFLTMLGPSGSGKSTTLNMIAGFLEPSAGSILLRGRDIVGLAPRTSEILGWCSRTTRCSRICLLPETWRFRWKCEAPLAKRQ